MKKVMFALMIVFFFGVGHVAAAEGVEKVWFKQGLEGRVAEVVPYNDKIFVVTRNYSGQSYRLYTYTKSGKYIDKLSLTAEDPFFNTDTGVMVLLNANSKVMSVYDMDTMNIQKEHQLKGQIITDSGFNRIAGDFLYADGYGEDGELHVVNLLTGKEVVLNTEYDVSDYEVSSSGITVFQTIDRSGSYQKQIEAFSSTGERMWTLKEDVEFFAISGEQVLAATYDKQILTIDLNNGSILNRTTSELDMKYEFLINTPDQVFMPALDGDKGGYVSFNPETGEANDVSYDQKTFQKDDQQPVKVIKMKNENVLEATNFPIRGDDYITRYNAVLTLTSYKGEVLWQHKTNQRIIDFLESKQGVLVLGEKEIIILNHNGHVHKKMPLPAPIDDSVFEEESGLLFGHNWNSSDGDELVMYKIDLPEKKVVKRYSTDKIWTVTFNTAMDLKSLKNINIVDNDGNSVDIMVKGEGEKAIITPVEKYERGQTYTILIPTTVTSEQGVPLKDEVRFSFLTVQ
ncbi:Ig-like domain-containing protein (plasmid) [Pontibacillus sp. ALD_SL1]|uniref:Ig-like domain-containing protein n=1 Tax=Pontibacillus sp. ALD_SL1 TaxID=2777185 RepID=UPI001A96F059|nr:Ig-like domain-containing protein [Pontibacillus sp. ALD_SL1]QST02283.1 Ig-like domain-containing protein [Pontibacillus sp. ALD_SL1]